MQLIVGLGNPGREYEKTRHNIGFRCLELLMARHHLSFGMARHGCRWAEGRIADTEVVLIQPLRYMNRSGEALGVWARASGLEWYSEETGEGHLPLVVVDDIALPLGSLRLRAKGSDGGHRGLESMARALGSDAYPRLRLGVGAESDAVPAEVWRDFVLEDFSEKEWEASEELVVYACEVLEAYLAHDLEWAASRFNRRPTTES